MEFTRIYMAIFLWVIGVVLLIISFHKLKRKRLIEGLATSKIRSLAMGLVEIFGKVELIKKFSSPFSKTDCVYCRYTIEEYRQQGKSSSWVMIKNGILKENFYLKDATGKVLVDPTKAEFDIPMNYETRALSPGIQKFLEANSIKHTTFFGLGRKSLRFREYLIKPNQDLFIIGTAGDNPYVEEGTGIKNEHDIMIQKGNDVYLISDKDEKALLKSYGWVVGITLVLGVLLTVIGFALGLIQII
ncbi:hypothetical protein J4477_04510 [Candidatus Pacearchaeota archaeon]|nr:hypothetical protein [Candidatus Pacearchaeota archaeon]